MDHGNCGMTAMISPKSYQLASSAHSWNSFELGMSQQIDDLEVEAKAKALALMQILPHNSNKIHIPVSGELTINTNKDILPSIVFECACCFTDQDQTALLQSFHIRFVDRQSQEFSTCYQNVSRYNKKLTRLMIGVGTMGYITPWFVDYMWMKRAELHNYEISDLYRENRVIWQFGGSQFQSWPYLQLLEEVKAKRIPHVHRSRKGLSFDMVFFRTKQADTQPTQATASEKAKYNQQLTQLSLKVRMHSFLKHFDPLSPPSSTSVSNPYMTSLFHNSYWRKTESNNIDHDEMATKLKMDQIKEKEDFLDVYHQFLTLIVKGPEAETDTGDSASLSSTMNDINDKLNEISLTDDQSSDQLPDWTKVDLIRFKKYERTCGWLRDSIFWEKNILSQPPII
ncbi:hypothetical protein WICPIJ_003977 [Wickerhamomyces pijperi]|uniref:Uncharacterized protein n=1 Tax=Wickerhamomyces pijperi TaxID=599730 RepID=A0A9P8TNC0_WICPI|nr:hypothetical protein WICPIJ_003977 [Wickerhamomyces pijperi]